MKTLIDYIKKLVLFQENRGTTVGYQNLSISNTSVGLTVPSNADSAILRIESTSTVYAVRLRSDGTAPTSSVGFPMLDGDVIEFLTAEDLRRLRFIEANVGTHSVHVIYFKTGR